MAEAPPILATTGTFLDRLDKLMEGYDPPPPPEAPDQGDKLRCLTTYAAENDPALKTAVAKVKAEQSRARIARQKAEEDFVRHIRPLNMRIDLDWKTRGEKRSAVFGCWAYTLGGCRDPSWVTRRGYSESAEACAGFAATAAAYGYGSSDASCEIKTDWRIKQPEGAFIFTYSQKPEPPDQPPELMRRLASQHVEVPERFGCAVADVVAVGEYVVAVCGGSARAPLVRVRGGSGTLHIGDLISVPLRDTKREPDGVLVSWDARLRGPDAGPDTHRGGSRKSPGPRPRADSGNPVLRWTADADPAAVKVERAAECPSNDEILKSLEPPSK